MMIAASDGAQALASAGIAAAISLVVAVLGQLNARSRDQAARQYERRRESLLNVQEAALALRLCLREYGTLSRDEPGQRSPELALAERQFDEARAALEVRLSRVDDTVVEAVVRAWQTDAEARFISVLDVSVSAEQLHWQALNDRIGAALQSRDGRAAAG